MQGESNYQLDHASPQSKRPRTDNCDGTASTIICKGASLLKTAMELLVTQVVCGSHHDRKSEFERTLGLRKK